MKIGIIAALPDELKPLVRGWGRVKGMAKGVSMWRRPGGPDEILAVCGGMGSAAALRAFAAAEADGPLDLVLSVGWAGALTGEENLSHVMSEIVDAQTGERFLLTEGERRLRVVTAARVADAAEKRRLRESYGAVLVDMEAAAIARLAQMRGIPMCCFKAVSDGAGAELPDINPFIGADGQLMLPRFLAHVAVRPQFWGALIEMGSRGPKAAKELARTIEAFLVEKDFAAVNRTGVIGKTEADPLRG
ncbi:adenosylhomocysteine nucleosidase [Granulicella rosea]|uniref:Adenosylhomocysteine nucleosidase n=1 Tax=Granulicella rosea TaxID=474952 RepID=A0A239J8Y9_9BACT|nr:hypothetical protein [Granulicella rosea]SNT02249.1 adenosylhomocysteine nucleosidase [Granulicella rosea]